MVWIRRVRTASGATAVQIVESVAGKRRVVRHVGSASTEVELGLLIAQAEELLADDRQGELDLGLTPTRGRWALIPAPAEHALFDPSSPPLARKKARGSAQPGVLRTSSRLLFDAIGGVYDDLGFDALGDDTFRDLVIARIVEPTSLLDLDRVLADLGRTSASLSTRKRTLKRCHNGAYRDRLAELCFAHAQTSGDISLVLYDVTTLLCRRRHNKVVTSKSSKLAGPSLAARAHAAESESRNPSAE